MKNKISVLIPISATYILILVAYVYQFVIVIGINLFAASIALLCIIGAYVLTVLGFRPVQKKNNVKS